MSASALAGFAYFGVVFAAGFALGTVRILVLEPIAGATLATLVELPMMLLLSWEACRRLVGRFDVPPRAAPRLVMGAVAFSLLILAETLFGIVGFGRTLGAQAATYRAPAALLGLLGQVVFALFPLLSGGRSANSRGRVTPPPRR